MATITNPAEGQTSPDAKRSTSETWERTEREYNVLNRLLTGEQRSALLRTAGDYKGYIPAVAGEDSNIMERDALMGYHQLARVFMAQSGFKEVGFSTKKEAYEGKQTGELDVEVSAAGAILKDLLEIGSKRVFGGIYEIDGIKYWVIATRFLGERQPRVAILGIAKADTNLDLTIVENPKLAEQVRGEFRRFGGPRRRSSLKRLRMVR